MPTTSRAPIHHVYRTKALGTTAELVVPDDGALVAASELLHRELERIDLVASRFRADSEISDLNRLAGRSVTVSADLFEAVRVALDMAAATDGLVDPTVGAALCRLGYDRDFAAVRNGIDGELPSAQPIPGWRCVLLDEEEGTITLPDGVSLDLGATAKALAADRAAATIAERLGLGVLVSLGGDVSVAGPAPAGGFAVGLADKCTGPAVEAVAISTGGLATSGTGTRHWQVGHEVVHHIVDPRTGLSARAWWRTVSTTASSCVEANAASTAAVVLGRRALPWLEGLRLPARLVHVDGLVVRTPGWPAPAAASSAHAGSVA